MSAPWERELIEVDEDQLDRLVQQVIMSADVAATERLSKPPATGAAVTRAAVRGALYSALANGFMTVRPEADWPEWVALAPWEREQPRPARNVRTRAGSD